MNPDETKATTPSALANDQKSTGGFGRITKAFGYSMQGLSHAVRYEAAFRQELIIALPASLILWFLPVSNVEKLLLFGSVLLVLIVELLNSAVEATVDRVSTERHPLSGRAKDLGSAAVFLAILLMAVSWALIVGPLLLTPLPK